MSRPAHHEPYADGIEVLHEVAPIFDDGDGGGGGGEPYVYPYWADLIVACVSVAILFGVIGAIGWALCSFVVKVLA